MCLIPNSFLMAEEQQIDGGAVVFLLLVKFYGWKKINADEY